MISTANKVATVVVLMFLGVCAVPAPAWADGKLTGKAAILLSTDGPSPFVLRGTAPDFGRFACYGEIEFEAGGADGSLEGVGVAVLRAADGALIVGVVSCQVDANGVGEMHFSWRDSVEFSDGTVVGNTGRFQRQRPPGVVIAIIAILIG
jgi:hypothetical protein